MKAQKAPKHLSKKAKEDEEITMEESNLADEQLTTWIQIADSWAQIESHLKGNPKKMPDIWRAYLKSQYRRYDKDE